jgi:type 2 lantibiotic biosynthesis protein LanM
MPPTAAAPGSLTPQAVTHSAPLPQPAEAPGEDALWRHVVARAATPWERLECPGFRPAAQAGPGAAEARLDAWARAVTGGDRAALGRLLAARGRSADDVRAAVCDVEVADEAALPDWAEDVRRLLETPPPARPLPPFRLHEVLSDEELAAKGGDSGAAWRLDPLVAPFVAAERDWLEAELAACALPVSPAVPRRLLARLARVVSDVTVQALIAKAEPAGGARLDTFGGDAADAPAAWAAVFRELPVLARVMALAVRHWREGTAELLGRLGSDLPLLERAFGGGAPLGALERCEPGSGDPHGGGRAVAMLTFSGGRRVVYKPRDLRVAEVYAALARTLNAAGLAPALHERTVLVRPDYAWEEFVHGTDCPDEAAVRRYYRRMGMHARLLHLTGGLDFTCDNVVAVGEHPVLIDLEMLTAPLLAPPVPGGAAGEQAERRAARLPTRSGIVTARIFGEPGRPPAELGALAAGGTRRAPFRHLTAGRGEDGQVRMMEEYPLFPTGAAAPRLHGSPVPSGPYLDEVEAGYLEMARVLRLCAGELASPGGPLAALGEAPVRFLARDTQIYMRMLLESLRPARLRDGVEREICLERLWKARFPHPGVVAQEVEELRELDVPLFTSRPATDAVDLRDAPPAPGFFQGSAMDAVRGRLAGLARQTDEDERRAIRGALAVAAPEHPVPLPSVDVGGTGGVDAGGFRAAAEELGDAILAAAFDAGEGPAWAALHYQPQHDAWQVGLLPCDTLAGTAGIAMVLADLRRAGAERFGGPARALLRHVAARAAGHAAEPPPAPGAPFCGGFAGWGSWMHALAHGSRALGDAAMLHDAAGALAALPLNRAPSAPTDLLGGRAGLLAGLLAVQGSASVHAALAGAAAALVGPLEAALSARWEPGAGCYPEGAVLPSLLPSGRDGVAFALARAEAAGLAGGAAAAWLAAAPPAAASGQHLARLAIVRLVTAPACTPGVVGAARAFAGAVDAGGATPDWLEAAEVALAVHAVTGDAHDLARAREIGGWIVARRRAHGSWFPDRLAPDSLNLSAVRGLAALAHLFTRLHAPGEAGSIRVME